MTLSPKKYMSNFTSSTTNRGVEAKEIEIANTRLDEQVSSRADSERAAPACASPGTADPDDTTSYIQVEVRRARRPLASSPAPAPPAPTATPSACVNYSSIGHDCQRTSPPPGSAAARSEARRGALGRRPPCDAMCPQRQTPTDAARSGLPAALDSSPWRGAAGDGSGALLEAAADGAEKKRGGSVWRKLSGCSGFQNGVDDGRWSGPERVEVYYFERGSGEFLATSGGAREALVERWARRWGGHAAGALRELLAVPRLLLAAPLGLLLAAEHAALQLARAALVGAVGAASDYALKPALALAFNALVHPPLVFARNVARALREALQPLWGALGDALEPAARLLAAARLVHVHSACHCAHQV